VSYDLCSGDRTKRAIVRTSGNAGGAGQARRDWDPAGSTSGNRNTLDTKNQFDGRSTNTSSTWYRPGMLWLRPCWPPPWVRADPFVRPFALAIVRIALVRLKERQPIRLNVGR
jgi:hypothetical protein